MKEERKSVLIRIPKDLWDVLDAASYFGKISINKLAWESLEARRKFIERKYLRNVDRK
jgi:hypothetical protein